MGKTPRNNFRRGICFWFYHGIGSETVFPSASGIQDWLQGFATKNSLPFMDPTESLRAISIDQGVSLHFRHDGHWNERGHEEVTNILADWLESEVKRGNGYTVPSHK